MKKETFVRKIGRIRPIIRHHLTRIVIKMDQLGYPMAGTTILHYYRGDGSKEEVMDLLYKASLEVYNEIVAETQPV
jgi:hypothetical protein